MSEEIIETIEKKLIDAIKWESNWIETQETTNKGYEELKQLIKTRGLSAKEKKKIQTNLKAYENSRNLIIENIAEFKAKKETLRFVLGQLYSEEYF